MQPVKSIRERCLELGRGRRSDYTKARGAYPRLAAVNTMTEWIRTSFLSDFRAIGGQPEEMEVGMQAWIEGLFAEPEDATEKGRGNQP